MGLIVWPSSALHVAGKMNPFPDGIIYDTFSYIARLDMLPASGHEFHVFIAYVTGHDLHVFIAFFPYNLLTKASRARLTWKGVSATDRLPMIKMPLTFVLFCRLMGERFWGWAG